MQVRREANKNESFELTEDDLYDEPRRGPRSQVTETSGHESTFLMIIPVGIPVCLGQMGL